MKYFPAFVTLAERPCLVVGGSAMAQKKAALLLRAGAHLDLVLDEISASMTSFLETPEGQSQVTIIDALPAASALRSYALVIAASENQALNLEVARRARAENVPLNVVDRTDLCTVIMPAIVQRGDVVVAISTGGASPVLARRLKAQIEKILPTRLAGLADFASSFREAVKAKLPWEKRRHFWQDVLDGPIAKDVLAGRLTQAREAMLSLINGPSSSHTNKYEKPCGRVSIVGAGPGDPDLLTLRALHALQDADVIFYDNLVGPDILRYARADAEHIAVGKSRAQHTKTQEEINHLLVSHAKAGRHVVRLKGGDPFIFGRGGEEVDYLKAHSIPVDVVPGITAASGCAASNNIALTHREHAKAVTFVTGHDSAHGQGSAPDLNWAALAQLPHTLVIYMGLVKAGDIAARLMAHGMAAHMPVAIVENGTRPDQKTVYGVLNDLGSLVRNAHLTGPTLLIIGEVAAEQRADIIKEISEKNRRIA